MRFIAKIQSVSDLITNSSSELFVVTSQSMPAVALAELLQAIGSRDYFSGDWESWNSLSEEEKKMYDSSSGMGTYREKVQKKAFKFTFTEKPFQIAIGSTGEPTIHPEFTEFLETVFSTSVVPNYTTNGIILSKYGKSPIADSIMEATSNFVGGVAVSFSNLLIRHQAEQAVDNFIQTWLYYGDDILYHVLLPLMPSGRSTKGIEDGVFEYLEEQVEKNNIKNVAFGAHFINALQTSKIKTWLYPAESLSKNVILTKDKVQITPSSFNLNPVKIINL